MKRLKICASGLALAAAVGAEPLPAAAQSAPAAPVVRLPGQSAEPHVSTPEQAKPPVTLRQELPADFSRETHVERLLSLAADWRDRGRKDLSAAALQRALALQPRNPEALYRRALYAAQDGDLATARETFDRLRPLVAATDQRLAQIAQAIGAPPPAPREAQEPSAATGPSRAPDPGAALRAAGFRQLEGQQLAAAERDFAQALRLRASDRDAAGGLGLVRLRQRRFAEALPLLERASAGVDGWRWSEALQTARFYTAFDRARAAVADGRLTVAEGLLKPLAAGDFKDRIEAQLLLADVYYRQHRLPEAAATYRGALQRDPHRGEAVAGLAQTLLQLGDAKGAAALVAQAPQGVNGPELARIQAARAKTLAEVGDTFGAGAALADAVRADPRNPWARYDYARFLLEHGESQAAAQVAAPLFASEAADVDTLQASALYAEAAGQLDLARSQLERIAKDRRNAAVQALAARLDVQGRIADAKALQRQGQSVAAITLLRTLLSQGGLSFGARSEIAQALLSLGDNYGAMALALEAARTPAPPDARPADAGGFLEVLAAAGQDSAAIALLNRTASAARSSEDQAAWRATYAGYATRRADQLREAGDLADAYDVLSQALASVPRDAGLLGALGRLYQSGGRGADARATYDLLLEAHPRDPAAYLEAARAAVAARDFGRAGALLRRAQSLKPNDPTIYYELGKLEQARGRERQAVQAFQEADSLLRGSGSAADGVPRPGLLGPNPFRLQPAAAAAPQPYWPALPPATTASPALALAWPAASYSPAAPGMGAPPTPPIGLASALPPSVPDLAPGAGVGRAPPVEILPGASASAASPLAPRLERDLAEAEQQAAARLDGALSARIRSGEEGSSRLDEVSARGTVASGALGRGRLSATVSPVALNAGAPTGDAAQRVGINPLIAAKEIVAKQTIVLPDQRARSAAGASVSIAYDSQAAHVDVGSTPVGFRQTNVNAGVKLTPQFGPVSARFTLEQRPVTDSVLAYAGDRDAATGIKTGPVTRDQVGLGASADFGGSGLYGDVAAKRLTGRGIESNNAYEFNAGAYFRVFDQDAERIQVGLNVNLQGYDENLRFFTLGHGGYFSPQQFIAVAVPVTYTVRRDRWWLDLNVRPGFQSYHENRAPIFPTEAALQAQMIALATQNSAVSAYYTGDSRTGFGISGTLRGEYQMTPLTIAGAMIQFDTFGRYSESIVSLYIKRLFAEDDGSYVLRTP